MFTRLTRTRSGSLNRPSQPSISSVDCFTLPRCTAVPPVGTPVAQSVGYLKIVRSMVSRRAPRLTHSRASLVPAGGSITFAA